MYSIQHCNGFVLIDKMFCSFKFKFFYLASKDFFLDFSWSSHNDYLGNKVSSRIGIFKRIMPCLTLPSTQTVYKSTIQPLFDCCRVVLDTCSETSSLRLQRLQNRAGRVSLLTDNCNPSSSVRVKLNWSTLQQRKKYNKAINA